MNADLDAHEHRRGKSTVMAAQRLGQLPQAVTRAPGGRTCVVCGAPLDGLDQGSPRVVQGLTGALRAAAAKSWPHDGHAV